MIEKLRSSQNKESSWDLGEQLHDLTLNRTQRTWAYTICKLNLVGFDILKENLDFRYF